MRSGMVVLAILISSGVGAQNAPAPVAAHNPELRKCKPCLAALGKSMAYLKANY